MNDNDTHTVEFSFDEIATLLVTTLNVIPEKLALAERLMNTPMKDAAFHQYDGVQILRGVCHKLADFLDEDELFDIDFHNKVNRETP